MFLACIVAGQINGYRYRARLHHPPLEMIDNDKPSDLAAIWIDRRDAAQLYEIEQATGLSSEQSLSTLIQSLLKYRDQNKKIALPAVVLLMNEQEAKDRDLID